MASVVFNIAKKDLLDGTIDLDTDNVDITLLCSNNNAEASIDTDTVSGLTLDECDSNTFGWGFGGNGRKALAGRAAVADDANDRGEFDANDVVWSAINASTNNVVGALILKRGTADDTDAVPIAYIDFASNVVLNGGDLTIQWDAEGILQLS